MAQTAPPGSRTRSDLVRGRITSIAGQHPGAAGKHSGKVARRAPPAQAPDSRGAAGSALVRDP